VAILGLSLAGVGQHYGKNELSICKTGNTAWNQIYFFVSSINVYNFHDNNVAYSRQFQWKLRPTAHTLQVDLSNFRVLNASWAFIVFPQWQ
jgi:hypothetical protein